MQNNRYTILVITGTRADFGLLASTLRHGLKSKLLNMKLLVTGMHTLKRHGATVKDIKAAGFHVDATVPVGENDSMIKCLAKEVVGIEKYCFTHRPDCLLVLGDRDEMMAGALVAGHLGIPLAHIHGGDLSANVVDDAIRHAITKFAHLHLAISKASAGRIRQLGEEAWRIHNVGAPGLDNLKTMKFKSRAALAKTHGLDPKKPWLVVLQHPTPLDPVPLAKQIEPTLSAVSKYDAERIVIYPNNDTGGQLFIRAINRYKRVVGWHLFPHLKREDYLSFLKHGDMLAGNSSSGVIESGFFHIPVINIGTRQQGREHGQNVVHVDYNIAAITRAIKLCRSVAFRKRCQRTTHPYGQGVAGQKIIRILEKELRRARLIPKRYV